LTQETRRSCCFDSVFEKIPNYKVGIKIDFIDMKRVVLIVDDEQELRKLLTVQLRREGFNVYSAESGEKALELLKAGVHIDAIVSDIRMPGGMDGVELIKTLKEQNIILPVNILMSGHAILNPEEVKALDLDHCFSKPFSSKKLAAILNEKLTNMDSGKSPRRYPRLQTEIGVGDEDINSQTVDVSLGGVFIKMDDPLPVGAKISVQIDLEPAFIAELEVKWIRESAEGTKPSGVGCEFINISTEDAIRLKEHLEQLDDGPDRMTDFQDPKKKIVN
jgi:CheY-like chemotaxis protein